MPMEGSSAPFQTTPLFTQEPIVPSVKQDIQRTTCYFFSKSETIQHLFECHHVKFLWHAVYIVLGISAPQNTEHLFNN
jgi:hypothetical protein